MDHAKYLRTDGTRTGWLEAPESPTDKEIIILSPLRRDYPAGTTMDHASLGKLVSIGSQKIKNRDQAGRWNGPSFSAEFVRAGEEA